MPVLAPILQNAAINTQAHVYFGGQCVSHSVVMPDGHRKSVGVILSSVALSFNTTEAETMECVAGACEFQLAGGGNWLRSGPGELFSVPADSQFHIRVAQGCEAYHYICHFAL